MYSFGEKFQELWTKIPEIATYWDYVGIANTIDDAMTNYEITKQDERTLLKALELFREERGIMLQ